MKGKKTGGRKSGSVNKINRPRERAKALAGEGQTPLEMLLETMRDTAEDMGVRLDCAKAAAPYVHSRKAQSVELTGKEGEPLRIIMGSFEHKTDGSNAELREGSFSVHLGNGNGHQP